MMKKVVYSFLLLTCSFFVRLHAQENIGYTWAKMLNNNSPLGGNVIAKKIKFDAAGNVIVTGRFNNTVDFDPGAGTVYRTSNGGYDLFLAKYSASGTLIDVKQIGGLYDEEPFALAVDGSGNIYIAGQFWGPTDFDPGTGTATRTSNGNYDWFFAKYDNNFNYILAKSGGSSTTDYCFGMAVDNSGAVYLTGSFYNTVDFDPGAGTANLTSAGLEDIFIAKYDTDGNYQFASKIGGTNFDIGRGIAVDASNNIYVTGSFRGTVDFDPGAGTVSFTSPASADDIFLAKYNSSGNYVYARQIGGTSSDQANAITLDASSNVYFTGYFVGTVDFDAGAGTASLVGAGSQDIFIAKYNASGNYVYARGMAGTGIDIGNDLTVDFAGDLYVTGTFQNTVDFDPGAGTVNLTSAGNNDFFFAKYNTSGNYVFAKGFGAASGDGGNGLALDGSGQPFVTGSFIGTVDFDAGAGTANLVSGTSVAGAFIAAYDNAGNYLMAVAAGGLDGNEYLEESRSIAVDASGNVYTAGYMRGTIDFDPGAGSANFASAGNQDIYFAKYDANGNYLFAKTIGAANNDVANSIAVDAGGNIYIAGYFQGTVDFDPGAGTANLTSGAIDAFFAKYDANGNYVFAKTIGGTGNDVCQKMILDGSNNLYLTGYFQNTVDFDPGAGTTNLTSAGANDIFLAKYDLDGNYVTAIQMGGSSTDIGLDITTDGSGNMYVAGYFSGTADFDPGAGTANLISNGSGDIFFAKYDASGNYVLAKGMGNFNNDEARAIAVDGAGNIYIAANFGFTVDFDPGAGTSELTGDSYDIAIAKYDASGNYVFAKQIGPGSFDQVTDMIIDGSGKLYVTGSIQGTVDFDPGPGTVNLTGFDLAFIASYDANGNYLRATGVNGVNTRSNSIAVDGSNNIYMAGYAFGSIDFDPGTGTATSASLNNGDIFIAKYSICSSPSLSAQTISASPATVSAATSLTDGGCRLLAVVEPNGASPVSGTVNAQLWIESSVPTYAGQPFVARHYEITPVNNASTATGRVTLYFTQQEFTDFNNHPGSALNLPTGAADATGIANLRIGKYPGSSNNGTGLPGSYTGNAVLLDPADSDIVWNATESRWEVSINVEGFSGFIVQTSATTLPVSLTAFTATIKGNQSLLSWSTSSEQNNKGFVVERSNNGRNYSAVGFVPAATGGNSNSTQTYKFIDIAPVKGRNYYRLQQQDVSGTVTYSEIRVLNFGTMLAGVLYPNPVGNTLYVQVESAQVQGLQLRLSDLQGRIVRTWTVNNAGGVLQLQLNGVIPGNYQLELMNDKGEREVHRIVKQ